MSIQITRWKCQHHACAPRTAQGIGSARALRVLGWAVDRDPDSDKLIILCPEHHPLGTRAAEVEAKRLAGIAGIAASVSDIIEGAGAVSETVMGWLPDPDGE